ncbi:hypothetical protein DESC_390008 [Desulfosarcina cetonica]|uniref:glycosyltransferase family 4 protein n=1 Tax=Desulfosarcina cetonica TaxID=90730 RepID=UPI0006D0F576|nr:glycosyltransferase family 4 protein [Desulfosarcina cetonica]VTR65905.1 hypothetical protein DESC_390008 [Desulfosarcina cetonica]
MVKILWIAPNLNHYKARFLSRLNQRREIDIYVFAGATNKQLGHTEGKERDFKFTTVPVVKEKFSYNPIVYIRIGSLIRRENFDWVLMPAEKKNIPLILYLYILKKIIGFKLITYNHPMLRFNSIPGRLEKLTPLTLFSLYDKVIFYTYQSMKLAIESNIINRAKAAYANNTLDTDHIWKFYSFRVNSSEPKRLLFIGRLVPYRELDLLLRYFRWLKTMLPGVELIVIGDGPEAPKIQKAAADDPQITWCGAITDEALVAKEMQRAHAVFMPGHSGLSIVHAFAYGKPYIASANYPNHPPEIDYLQDGVNGLLLNGNMESNLARIAGLLDDAKAYERMCRAAFAKAQELSIANWCAQLKTALIDRPIADVCLTR